jgi:Xaa-Pro aminopeptidase
VSWLTGFVPYWSEALLVLPRDRDPVLVVALTYRVKTWIERTSRAADVIHTPRIGLEAARRIAAQKPDAAVGVVELDTLSAGIAGDLAEGGPRLTVTDASEVFAQLRAQPDPAEIALAEKAASIAHVALAQISRDGDDLGSMLAAAEAAARRHGAEEIYLAAAPDLDRDLRLRRLEGSVARGPSFAVRASVAYKGSWVRLTRTIHPDDAAARQAIDAFAGAVAQLPEARGLAAFPSWLVEGCRFTQPLDALMGSRVAPPTPPLPRLLSVQARIDVGRAPVLIGAPVLLGALGQPARLLAPPVFD